jgi:hypothetical protein
MSFPMPALLPVLFLLLSIIAAGEIARRIALLPRFATLGRLGRRASAVVMRRGVSEHFKERATRILAARMMAASLSAGVALIVVIAPVVLLLLIDGPLPLGVRAAFVDWQARILLLTTSLSYALVRWRYRQWRVQPR